jgi:hypothetical protein
MKNVFFVIWVFLMSSVAFAGTSGNIYVEIKKDVNGGQLYGLPVFEMSIAKAPLLIDIEFRNNFTSPRGSLGIPNHLSSELNFHVGIKHGAFWTTFSLDPTIVYEGNDYGRPAGWYFDNKLRAGAEFEF